MDILTFRDWKEKHVSVKFDINGGVKVFSFGDEKIFDTKDDNIVEDLKNEQHILYKYFKKHFDLIQKKYKSLLDKTKKES